MADEEKVVIAETTIEASPEDVWRALTEGEELKRWFPPDARVTPGVGGAVWLSWGEGMEWEAPITIWEPNRHLRTIDPPPSKLAVDYFVESRGSETVLRIVHSGFAADAWEDEIDTLESGWRSFAANLQLYLQRHRGEPRTMAFYRHDHVEMGRPEAFRRVMEAFGIELVAEGERFTGKDFQGIAQVVAPPINFSGTLASHDDGFLMIEIEPGRDRCRPAAWVSLYADAGRDASALEQRLRDTITAAFPSPLLA